MWAVVLSAVAGGVVVAAVVALQAGFGVGSSHFSLGQTLFGENPTPHFRRLSKLRFTGPL